MGTKKVQYSWFIDEYIYKPVVCKTNLWQNKVQKYQELYTQSSFNIKKQVWELNQIRRILISEYMDKKVSKYK